ncbi:hypothetical protein ABZ851_05635 [Streptomyces sp. NPDC047049]|uniref:hypothetical protein n=1 Tax=Streptomyces sp. NPDC047049 TaxID=3156688 RepID=UPI0033DE5B08
MRAWNHARRTRRVRGAASSEIEGLQQSLSLLLPDRSVPLRVRLALRIFDRYRRTASLVNFACGLVVGLWWPIPIVLAIDDRPGSARTLCAKVVTVFEEVAKIENPGSMIEGCIRLFFAVLFLASLYFALALGPLVLSYRVSRGYSGLPIPGRRAVRFRWRSLVTATAVSALAACAKVIGKTGERRILVLHALAAELGMVRSALASLPRLDYGPLSGRRRRRKHVASHVRQVSARLEQFEMRIEKISDDDVRRLGLVLFLISERVSDRRYLELAGDDFLSGVDAQDRDPLRLAIGAGLCLILSSATVGVMHLLGLPDGIQPVAIGVSVIISAVIVFRGRALEKLESLGLLGGGREQRP